MKQIRFNRFIQIGYPLLVYFIVYQLGIALLIDLLGDKYGKLTCLLIAGIVCIFPMLIIYKSIPKLIPEPFNNNAVKGYILWIIGVVALGVLSNIIISNTGLVDSSAGFDKASQTLSDGSFVIKILCNCLVIPILEELLIRGIITGQLYLWYGFIPAAVISSIFFGILHNNIVQFIYAVIMGVALATMYIKTKRLSLCIVAHCLINLIVIIFS